MHSKRISRLLETDKLVNELNYSKDEAAQELSVSEKTIERDLAQLEELKESTLDADRVNGIRNELFLKLSQGAEEVYEAFLDRKNKQKDLSAHRYFQNFLSAMARIAEIFGLSGSNTVNVAIGLSSTNTVKQPREKVDPELAERFGQTFIEWHEEKRRKEFVKEQSS